ncbi:hypothetical protein LINGRAHAP2_LOCUS21631 [Linum grandiflorum]
MAASYTCFLFIILLSITSAATAAQNTPVAAAPKTQQQQQNSTSTTHEPFSAATARTAPAAPARAPPAIECIHEASRNVIRRCMTWIVTVGPAVNPSMECCDAVRKARLMPCLCSYVTRDMEDLVSVNKLIRVFNSCGKRVRPGTKCASYTVPKA